MCVFGLTGVDEELIGNSGMVYIMDSCSKQSGKDLQVSKDSLNGQRRYTEKQKRLIQRI